MKKKLSFFLAFIMLIGILPLDVFADNLAMTTTKNDNDYEEVIIDGMLYKSYNVSDFMEPSKVEKSWPTMTMSRYATTFQAQEAPAQGKSFDFYLDLRWSTVDRPIAVSYTHLQPTRRPG